MAAAPALEPIPQATAELTVRAVLLGALIGAVQTVANIYMALKTGVWDGGFPTAAILAFALAGALRLPGFSPRENLVSQCVAAAACAVPAVAGLLGAIPALEMLGRGPGALAIALWGLALGVLGTVLALPLRRKVIEEEALAFPTGKATADVIGAMHTAGSGALASARALGISGALAMALTFLRDGPPALLPAMTALPLRIGGIGAGLLTIGIGWSPLMLGIGAMVGPQIGLSMLLGAALAWGVLAPAALALGEVPAPEFPALVQWLTWPGVALMISGAIVSLALQSGTLLRGLRWRGRGTPSAAPDAALTPGLRRAARLLAGAAVVAIAVLAWRVFGLHPIAGLLAVALSVPLAGAAVRAAGETDFMPLGQMGQITQAAFGPLSGGSPVSNIGAGAVAGDIGATGVLVYMMRAGRDLGSSVPKLFVAALVGVTVGAAVAIPAYQLVTRAYGLGSEALPAAPARTWKAFAEILTGRGEALPPHAWTAAVIAAALGVGLALLSRSRLAGRLPSAVAMGVAFIIPAYYSVTIALGALLFALARRRFPAASERLITPIGSGAIAGESLMGVTIAILIATGVLGRR